MAFMGMYHLIKEIKMLNLFNRKKITLTALGAEITASVHTNGHTAHIHEIAGWLPSYSNMA